MTTAALIFLLGLGIGWIGQSIWAVCAELIDIYREESRK